ncbi:H6ST2-like protein [Mya arenaria]|uniref:Heparan-sulfate 6-O-sulfotransferase n=1 Tax=Mya arenaria TaxID=6604 RepID=A0ABY7G5R1_MYAAR|nr:heparan-sulfate 6-O-sulfotransferase 2-like [Mya arenaria]WAR28508.1 H6ST2-like protein [Mya arenaria]
MHYVLYNRYRNCLYFHTIRRVFKIKMTWRKAIIFLIIVALFSGFVFLYTCGNDSCSPNAILPAVVSDISQITDSFNAYKDGRLPYNNFNDTVFVESHPVNFDKEDVIVFLHIQKTGGTSFGRHLVKNLELESPCKCHRRKKRCDCYTSKKTIWLFSRYSTGWVCGLHADWTELNSCVEEAMNKKEKKIRKRRYHYITVLRDPVKRFLSEWKHVQRGATWKTAKLVCNGHSAVGNEVPLCFNGTDWSDVTLDEFLSCKHNLAKNRQTRMLADLAKVNCYNTSSMTPEDRDQKILDSAKENLLNMDFFGLTEFQLRTQKLFEYTFDIHFKKEFEQLPVTHSDRTDISKRQKSEILEQNKLDIALYQYAKDLFLQRTKKMREKTGDTFVERDYDLLETKDQFDDSVDFADDEDDDS